MEFDVVVVGGGFCGSVLVTHLLAAGVPRVALIERSGDPGRGIAYGPSTRAPLLNVPAGEMSALPDDPDHFLRWLGDARPGDYVSRRRYGDYLSDMLAAACGEWRLFSDEAIGLLPVTSGFQIRLRSGVLLQARQVVLAIGQFAPAGLKPAAGFEDRPWYADDPWSLAASAPLFERGNALVVGTGLTAVDVALALVEQGGAEQVYMVSRHAWLPLPQVEGSSYPDWFDPAGAPLHISELLRIFRKEVARSGLDPRIALDAMRPHLPGLWQRLPWVERRRFLRHLRPRFEAVRNRLPIPTSNRLGELIEQGRIIVRADRITAFSDGVTGATVHFRAGGFVEVKRVVNCTGPDMYYRRINHPLILDVIGTGVGRPEPLGLGLDVGTDFRLLDEDGRPTSGLYTVGAPTKGRWWEVSAVRELRQQLIELATIVAKAYRATSS